MANKLKMADFQAILQLHSLRWSQRRIARELGINRSTVAKAIQRAEADSKPAKVLTGSEEPKPATLEALPAPDPKPAKVLTGAAACAPTEASAAEPAAGNAPDGMPISRNWCEPYRQQIVPLVEQGLSAKRIWQDLVRDGAKLKYDSVQRFVRKLTHVRELPFRPWGQNIPPGLEGRKKGMPERWLEREKLSV